MKQDITALLPQFAGTGAAPDKSAPAVSAAPTAPTQPAAPAASVQPDVKPSAAPAETAASKPPAAAAARPARPGPEPSETGPAPAGGKPSGQGASPPPRIWEREAPPRNPYLAGVFLGLTLLAAYLILGTGLGASGGVARLAAWLEHGLVPARVEASAYFGAYFPAPLAYYLVFMLAGIFLGGLLSAAGGGRLRLKVERGPTASRSRRLFLALAGGVLSGFAARLAQGCTSGQGLSGGALLLTGSAIFLVSLFVAGYLTAWLFGRQWR